MGLLTTSAGVVGSASSTTGASLSRIMSDEERTFIAIKPDGVHRGLVGEIIKRFELKGFKLVGLKMTHASEELLKQHYDDLKDRPFFAGLVDYMHSGPVVAMVWEGKGAVKTGRVLLGETNPANSLPGTIRGDFCIDVGRNICHGSDAVESANHEIALWFTPEELVDCNNCSGHDVDLKHWLRAGQLASKPGFSLCRRMEEKRSVSISVLTSHIPAVPNHHTVPD